MKRGRLSIGLFRAFFTLMLFGCVFGVTYFASIEYVSSDGPFVNIHASPSDFADPATRRLAQAAAAGQIKQAIDAARVCPQGVNTSGVQGSTALLMAVERGNLTMVAALLKAGANPDGAPGSAPLHAAVKNNDLRMIRLLLNAHANPERTLGNETPLAEASITGSVPAMQLLVSAGAVVDQPDEIGRTNAMNAAAGDNWRAVAFLLDHGASPWREANGITIAVFAAKTRLLPNNADGAALRGVKRLGITTLAQLADQDADRLYLRLCEETARRHDPCVHDVFAAAIHQARTGQAVDWWSYTAARKLRQAAGDFPQPAGS